MIDVYEILLIVAEEQPVTVRRLVELNGWSDSATRDRLTKLTRNRWASMTNAPIRPFSEATEWSLTPEGVKALEAHRQLLEINYYNAMQAHDRVALSIERITK